MKNMALAGQSFDQRWTMTGRKSMGEFTFKTLNTNMQEDHIVSHFDATFDKTPIKAANTQ